MVNVFTRSLTDDLASLVKQVDKAVAAHKDKQMAAFVVLLSDDPDAAEADLKAFAAKHGIKEVPLTLFDGIAGPPDYKIAQDAEVTVHLWKGLTVQANYAFGKGKLGEAGIAQVVKDTDKILK